MKVFIALILVALGAIALTVFYFSHMPGQSPAPTTTAVSEDDHGASERIGEVCEALAHGIGQRSTAKNTNVVAARELIEQKLHKGGMRPVERPFASRGNSGVNVEVELEGNAARGEVVVLGAHYDSEPYSPGADDNASGCAVLLEIARTLNNAPHNRTIDIVFFDFGSARFAGTADAGSHFWADEAKRAGKNVTAMLSIDSIGRFVDLPGSQSGPFPLSLAYPKTGNFVLFAGDLGARQLVLTCTETMRLAGGMPCEGVTLPGFLPWLDKSDHYAFRQNGWPAIVVTDTGPLRNSEHGLPSDTPDRLSYDRMGIAAVRLVKVVQRLAQSGSLSTSVN